MGVLRWRSLLDTEIGERSAQVLGKLDLEVLTALRLGVYQIGWLSRIPARAAIDESVELVKRARKRSAAGFVNAVLRKVAGGMRRVEAAREVAVSDGTAETLAAHSAHPLWLVERWIATYGMDAAAAICWHDQAVPVTAIRLRSAAAEEALRAEGIELAAGSRRPYLSGHATLLAKDDSAVDPAAWRRPRPRTWIFRSGTYGRRGTRTPSRRR